jgi:hypothetical protein
MYFTGSNGNSDGSRIETFAGNQIPLTYKENCHTFSTGASFFWSSPATGLQIYFEMGYNWSKSVLRSTKSFAFPTGYPPPFDTTPANVRAIQRESGIEYWFEINYFQDRLYMYGFTLDLFGSEPTGSRKTDLMFTVLDPITGQTVQMKADMNPIESSFFLTILVVSSLGKKSGPSALISLYRSSIVFPFWDFMKLAPFTIPHANYGNLGQKLTLCKFQVFLAKHPLFSPLDHRNYSQ